MDRWQGHYWKPATVESFGKQEIYELVIERRGVQEVIRTTESHRWYSVNDKDYQDKRIRFNRNIVITKDLKPKDLLFNAGTNKTSILPQIDGIRHGFVFGDGNKPGETTTAQFFGNKDASMYKYFSDYKFSEEILREGTNVPSRRAYGLPGHYKMVPLPEYGKSYLYGFLAGYFAADGNIHDSGAATISSSKMENMKMIKSICGILNLGYGSVSTYNRKGIDGIYRDIYSISLHLKDLKEEFFLMPHHLEYFKKLNKKNPRQASMWRVKEVRATGFLEEVFCVVEPETESFTLANGILTKNCGRYWNILFEGVETTDTWQHRNIRLVNSGSAAHEDLQNDLVKNIPGIEIEKELWHKNPNLHCFIDAYIPESNTPIEIKTTSAENFEWRQSKMVGTASNELQLLGYMFLLESELGFLVYEDRNSLENLIIPVRMTDENRTKMQAAFDWMTQIQTTFEEGKVVKQFAGKRANSVVCNGCKVKEVCENTFPEGTVDIPLLSKVLKVKE